jgi:hypothetical protein
VNHQRHVVDSAGKPGLVDAVHRLDDGFTVSLGAHDDST